MQSDTLEERYVIEFCFKLGKHSTETYGMLQTAFGASWMNRTCFFEWHKRVKEVREFVRDDERCWRIKEVNTQEDFHEAFQKLLELYNEWIAAGGDYSEGD